MADDLESRLAPQDTGLENTVESDWSIGRILWDTVKYAPLGALAYLIGGPASLITPITLGIGKYITNRKKKKKTQWKDMRKTLAVANFGGAIAYWAYAVPDMIIGSPVGLVGKIAKTLLFNPMMLAPWMAWYRTTTYIVEKHGGWGLIKSLFNFKIFKYIKEAYNEDLKKKYLSNMAELFLTVSPIHFYSMNYVTNPTVRVGIGGINDILLSLIAGDEGLLKNLKRRLFVEKKIEDTKPYSLQSQYKDAA
jgi:hypothetical protein